MNCKKCGSPLVPGAAMCSACGASVMNNEFSTPPSGVQSPVGQPPMGQPMSGQAPMGQPPMGQPMPGQAPMSQPPMGQPMPGQAPMGQPPMGQPMPGQAPMGQPPMGQPMPGQAPMGQPPMGQPMPGQAPMGQPPMGQLATPGADKKGKSKIGLIIVILLAIAAVVVGGVVIASSAQDQNETKKSEKKKDKDKEEKEEITPSDVLEKSVSIKSEVKLADGGILFIVSNTSSKTLTLSFEVEFYDANDLILGSSVDNTSLAPNSDGYLYFNEYAVKEGYTKYLTNMTVVDYSDMQKVVTIPETEFVKNETEDELILQYKNTGTETLGYVSAVVLFYSNNQIVAYDDSTKFDIQAGSNANLSFYIDLIKQEVAYDRYEIHGFSVTNTYSD